MIELRLKQLEGNINQDLELLHEYELALRYEDDPRRIARYRKEIERQRESWTRYKQEYNELHKQIASDPIIKTEAANEQLQQMNVKLDQMDAKLDSLQEGNVTILNELIEMRKAVLIRFDTSEQKIISSVVGRLDLNQIETVRSVLDAVEANRVSECELHETLSAIQEALTEIQKQDNGIYDPQLVNESIKLSDLVDDPKLDFSHKLKVSVPIIPLILSYEGEIGLKSGVNLRKVWQGLRAKVRGEK